MYLIVNSEYKIVDISNISRYVRRQPNGIVVLCDRADAEAIYSDDHNKYYPIDRVGYVAEFQSTLPAGGATFPPNHFPASKI